MVTLLLGSFVITCGVAPIKYVSAVAETQNIMVIMWFNMLKA